MYTIVLWWRCISSSPPRAYRWTTNTSKKKRLIRKCISWGGSEASEVGTVPGFLLRHLAWCLLPSLCFLVLFCAFCPLPSGCSEILFGIPGLPLRPLLRCSSIPDWQRQAWTKGYMVDNFVVGTYFLGTSWKAGPFFSLRALATYGASWHCI